VPTVVPIEPFLAARIPLIDVRSPGEHARGHIPGAANIPIFSNEERAVVGTLYRQKGREAAMLEGLRLVGPKLAAIVEQAKALAPRGKVGVHCWRGGERSASVGWLLEKTASMEVLVLKKGYKAFRQHVLASFSRTWKLEIAGGYTGTGKTELLGLLRERGAQTLDLEGLAHHKGSAFGGIGESGQPTTEQFENLIWDALRQFEPGRPVWVEDESQLVGWVKIPDQFHAQMRSSPVSFVDMPVEQRAARLVKDYGSFPKEELAAAIMRIQKRLGPQHAKSALEALASDDLHRVAMITLTYYDKTYARGLANRDPHRTRFVPANGLSLPEIAEILMEHERTRST